MRGQITTVTVDIDTRYRLDKANTSAANFVVKMDRRFINVVGARVRDAMLPVIFKTVMEGQNILYWRGPAVHQAQKVIIDARNYTPQDLAAEVKAKLIASDALKGFDFSYDATENKFVAKTTNGNVQLLPTDISDGNSYTSQRLWETLGGNKREPVIMGVAPGTLMPNEFTGQGTSTTIYIGCRELSDVVHTSTNVTNLPLPPIVKIPMKIGDLTENGVVSYTPTAAQMYQLSYRHPIEFEYLHIYIYALREVAGINDTAYRLLNFGTEEVNLTLDIQIME